MIISRDLVIEEINGGNDYVVAIVERVKPDFLGSVVELCRQEEDLPNDPSVIILSCGHLDSVNAVLRYVIKPYVALLAEVKRPPAVALIVVPETQVHEIDSEVWATVIGAPVWICLTDKLSNRN